MYMYNIIIKFALVLIYLHYGRILKKKTAKAGEFSFLSFFFGRLEIKLKKEGEYFQKQRKNLIIRRCKMDISRQFICSSCTLRF